MCQVIAFKLLLSLDSCSFIAEGGALFVPVPSEAFWGDIKAKLGDRNGLFEGSYVFQSYHKPSVKWPNSSGNGAWQQSAETHTISVSQVEIVCGRGGNKMEQLYATLRWPEVLP